MEDVRLAGRFVGQVGRRGEDCTFGVLEARYQIGFGKGGDAFVNRATTAQVGDLGDQRRGHELVVFAAHLDLPWGRYWSASSLVAGLFGRNARGRDG